MQPLGQHGKARLLILQQGKGRVGKHRAFGRRIAVMDGVRHDVEGDIRRAYLRGDAGVENQPHPVILRAVVQRVADMQQRVALFDGQRQLNRADGQLLRPLFL